MQLKVFRRPTKEALQFEVEVNEWLRANNRCVTIQRDSHVYHNHATGEDDLVVLLWYGMRNEV